MLLGGIFNGLAVGMQATIVQAALELYASLVNRILSGLLGGA
jgi:hypothetical protein